MCLKKEKKKIPIPVPDSHQQPKRILAGGTEKLVQQHIQPIAVRTQDEQIRRGSVYTSVYTSWGSSGRARRLRNCCCPSTAVPPRVCWATASPQGLPAAPQQKGRHFRGSSPLHRGSSAALPIEEIYSSRSLRRSWNILVDPSHPQHYFFKPLPSVLQGPQIMHK